MFKKIFSSIGIYFAVLIVLFIGVFINDIKTNGLSFVTTGSGSSNFSTQAQDTIIRFKASSNYLGTIELPIATSNKTVILFRIKEQNAKDWYYEATYSGKFIANLTPFPFGFGVIADSSQKNYVVEVKSFTPHSKFNLLTQTIYSKYVFNKTLLIHNKHLATIFLINKTKEILSSFYLWFVSLCITLLFIFFRSSVDIKDIKKVASKIYLGENWLVYIVILYIFVSLLSGMILFLLIPVGVYLYFTILRRTVISSYFLIPIFLLGEMTLLLLVHNSSPIAYLLSIFMIFFITSVLQELVNTFISRQQVNEFYTKIVNYLVAKRYNGTTLLFGVFVVFLVVLLIATFNKTYYLGGDDSRLYFLYPKEYFVNLVSKVGPETAASDLISWLPPVSIAPFVSMLLLLKLVLPFANIQSLMYMLNILGGLVFFYLFLNYLIPQKEMFSRWVKITGSILYVFSIFNFYTLFNSQLIANFLLGTFPLSIYLYIRGIREKKLYFIVIIALLWSLFAYFTSAFPWFAGAIMSLIPVLLLEIRHSLKRTVLYSLLLGALILLLNAYWLTTLSSSSVIGGNHTSTSSSISSISFREQNAEGIKVVSATNTIFYPLLNLYQYDIQNNFKWSYLPIFTSWYLKILPLNLVFLLVILLAGKLLKTNDPLKSTYITTGLSFILALYLYTVNIGKWGIPLFVALNNYIPGFVMFRNMYDKLGFAISFSLALVFTISLFVVLKNIQSVIKKIVLLILITIILLLNAEPFLIGEFADASIWTTQHTVNKLTNFNSDFMHLIAYIRQQDTDARYLWVPLNAGNSVQVQDEDNPDYYYNGVSPLLFLTGKNDYSGLTSFGSFNSELKKYLYDKDYQQAGYLYQRFNVGYIIVDNSRSDEFSTGYLCGEGLCDVQNKKYLQTILGKKIRDFGKRYILYTINNTFANQKIYTTNDLTNFTQISNNATFQKISNTEYKITLKDIRNDFALVFLSPYYKSWELRTTDNQHIIASGAHSVPFGYANGWVLHVSDLKQKLPKDYYSMNKDGAMTVVLHLYFNLGILYTIGLGTSGLLACIAIGYVVIMLGKDLQKKDL